jgi:pyruvate ferredoxin oxidoreductase gamma subunit
MGAPVISFCRIADKPIRLREPILEPDAVIVQDVTLLGTVPVFQGLSPKGYVLVNSAKTLGELGLADALAKMPQGHVRVVSATELAMRHVGRPVPNAALLGAFAGITGALHFASVEAAIREKFKGAVGDGNVTAARAAFDDVTVPA